MSHSTKESESTHQENIKSNSEHLPIINDSSKKIRQGVEDRHWQLFEARLKKQLPDVNKENYTMTNDYRIIDRFKKVDQPQTPIEPNRRWETFCHQVTNKSNETNRVMSIFHNVWQKNWHTKPTNDIQKRRMTDPTGNNENAFLNRLSTNDNDRKKITSILHRASSSERFSSTDEKKNQI